MLERITEGDKFPGSFQDKLNAAIDALNALEVAAGAGVTIDRTGDFSFTINCTATGDGGGFSAPAAVSLPAGFFRVIDIAEYDDNGAIAVNALRLVNSAAADPSAEHTAGICRAYGKTYDVPAFDFEILPTAKYIYLKFRGVDLGMPFICYGSDKILAASDDLALLASIDQETREIIQILPETQQLELGHGYEGGFAIMPMSDGRFKISDGQTDCGWLRGWFVNGGASNEVKWIYCVVQYSTETDSYYLSVSHELPTGDDYGFFSIGCIRYGKIEQEWRGGTHYFGERYFV